MIYLLASNFLQDNHRSKFTHVRQLEHNCTCCYLWTSSKSIAINKFRIPTKSRTGMRTNAYAGFPIFGPVLHIPAHLAHFRKIAHIWSLWAKLQIFVVKFQTSWSKFRNFLKKISKKLISVQDVYLIPESTLFIMNAFLSNHRSANIFLKTTVGNLTKN